MPPKALLSQRIFRRDRFVEVNGADMQLRARRMVETLALALSGALLVQHAPKEVADAFCASRLGGDWGLEYGTLPSGVAVDAILERARPKVG